MTELLEEYALIAEIISGIAIIVSLIFVGVQIKRNTQATQASTFQAIADLDINLLLSFGNSKELARLISTFRDDPDSLTEEEQNHGNKHGSPPPADMKHRKGREADFCAGCGQCNVKSAPGAPASIDIWQSAAG